MTKVCEWNATTKTQITRDMTPEEENQRLADIAASGLPVVPQSVTSRQAHAALIKRGHDISIDAYINAIADPVDRKLTRNEYEQSTVFARHRPLVLTIGAELGLDLDELFIYASTL